MTMQQVADRLGVSPRTVENHLARAMVHCRKRLRGVGRDA
jgi:RNA polymerase sigma-70 factor (ECF subfamily)